MAFITGGFEPKPYTSDHRQGILLPFAAWAVLSPPLVWWAAPLGPRLVASVASNVIGAALTAAILVIPYPGQDASRPLVFTVGFLLMGPIGGALGVVSAFTLRSRWTPRSPGRAPT